MKYNQKREASEGRRRLMVKAVGGSKVSMYLHQHCPESKLPVWTHFSRLLTCSTVLLFVSLSYSSFAGFPITGGNGGEEPEPPKKKNKQKEEQNSAKDEESEESLPWWRSSLLICRGAHRVWHLDPSSGFNFWSWSRFASQQTLRPFKTERRGSLRKKSVSAVFLWLGSQCLQQFKLGSELYFFVFFWDSFKFKAWNFEFISKSPDAV